jgi:hypothetical protein
MMQTKRTLAALGIGFGSLVVASGAVSAHPVGEPGTPSCFGERVSHGSSDSEHMLTPVERAEALEWTVYESGFVSPEEVDAFEERFGVVNQDVTVRVFVQFVRANCSDDPFVE